MMRPFTLSFCTATVYAPALTLAAYLKLLPSRWLAPLIKQEINESPASRDLQEIFEKLAVGNRRVGQARGTSGHAGARKQSV